MRKQHGITLIGFAIVLVIVGFFVYAAMKLIPVYTEYFGVVKSMKSLQSDARYREHGHRGNPAQARTDFRCAVCR